MTEVIACNECGTQLSVDGLAPEARPVCHNCGTAMIDWAGMVETVAVDQPAHLSGSQWSTQAMLNQVAGLAEGQMLGRCRIKGLLGKGGMGEVYLAEHTTLQVPVAIKILSAHLAASNPQFTERFMREAQLAARIRHPNVMAVMDAVYDAELNLHYIVLEYVDGGSVGELVREGAQSTEVALSIVEGVASALAVAAEHNVVHRDIKPDNIMRTAKGLVKLADLGLAKDVNPDTTHMTHTNAIMGTPAYISPEQAEDTRSADIRADIYSLGATLFHLLTGEPPYVGTSTLAILKKLATEPTPDPRDRHASIPEAVAAICMKMMAKDKADRYTTPQELLQDIHKVREGGLTKAKSLIAAPFANGQPTPIGVSGGGGGVFAWLQTLSPRMQIGLSAVAALVVVSISGMLLGDKPTPPPTPPPTTSTQPAALKSVSPQPTTTPVNNTPVHKIAPLPPTRTVPPPTLLARAPELNPNRPDSDNRARTLRKNKNSAYAQAGKQQPAVDKNDAFVADDAVITTRPATKTLPPEAELLAAASQEKRQKTIRDKLNAAKNQKDAKRATTSKLPPVVGGTSRPVRRIAAKPAPQAPAGALVATASKPEKLPPALGNVPQLSAPTTEAVTVAQGKKAKSDSARLGEGEKIRGSSQATTAKTSHPKHQRQWQSISAANEMFAAAEKLRLRLNPIGRKKRYQEAEARYKKIITTWSNSDKVIAANYQLGNLYESIFYNNYRRSIEYYKRSLALQPQQHSAVYWRIAVLYDNRLADHQTARTWFERAAKNSLTPTMRSDAKQKVKELKARGF